ncbi:lysozyme family protein [Bacillus altitudinis]|uniref:lysozyme family protein n=1 Tax=Bacillus altitudinis TaxID=293387 RepID=UPI003D1D6F6C
MFPTKDSIIRLLNVKWSSDYKHVRLFPDLATQTAWFKDQEIFHLENCSYQRKDSVVKAPYGFDSLAYYNYVAYYNDEKWYYAFIKDKIYLSDKATSLVIETDVMQTYMFDMFFGDSFIERRHCPQYDSKGRPIVNTQPESLEMGDMYETIKSYKSTSELSPYTLLTAKGSISQMIQKYPNLPDHMPPPITTVAQGIQTGLEYLILDARSDDDDGQVDDGGGNDAKGELVNVNDKVLSFTATVEYWCSHFGIPDYSNLVLAIIMVESGGNGTDVMQSSESRGLPPNSAPSTSKSIEWGVEHLKNMLTSASSNGLNDWSAVQAYNFGGGYISWLKGKGYNEHTTSTAEEYAKEKANGSKTNYNNAYIIRLTGKDWRYSYGNMFYVLLVQRYIKQSAKDTPLSVPVDTPYRITQDYKEGIHGGIDFGGRTAGVEGDNIYSAGNGRVTYAGYHKSQTAGASLGNYVCVYHPDLDIHTGYAHLSSINVKVGDTVRTGTKVGEMGNTGDSKGVHLHFNAGNGTGVFGPYIDPTNLIGVKRIGE